MKKKYSNIWIVDGAKDLFHFVVGGAQFRLFFYWVYEGELNFLLISVGDRTWLLVSNNPG